VALEEDNALPARTDVLVIGAGPAGSACALWLARHGVDVVLADQHAFPRDKVCGDGLIPDAHAALKRLGVYDEVMAAAQRASHVGAVAPSGGRVDVPGQLAVLPRRELDMILCRAAVNAGAKLLAPARFEAPIEEAGAVVGARMNVDGRTHELRARHVVLATGARPQALIAAGLCERREPSGVALRGYVRNDAMAGRMNTLDVVWHRRLRGGYGWIFPAPGSLFNIGVGLLDSHERSGAAQRRAIEDVNLRELFATFCEVYAPARELMRDGIPQGDLKGAPLRCSLQGARLGKAGLRVTGEAAGSTYSFTGEGIGKAMETGLLAAENLLAARDADLDDAQALANYEAAIAQLKPRFDLYERANRVNHRPWLADLLVWRAQRSPRVRERMAGVLDESRNPGSLVTARGLLMLFLPG